MEYGSWTSRLSNKTYYCLSQSRARCDHLMAQGHSFLLAAVTLVAYSTQTQSLCFYGTVTKILVQ